ncbi:Lrp/AsnC family transcriptional regulator [Actinoallomurus purpureus]|uniref:Lrp/AsnC family transcriptional regulator n=1 Tax=Actinoallomurus purpureus TaxID=478114 RepID=UPI0020933F94|nr:Lrp/AsnC family transcriptional regulator [Actinoallomurus purpureus]MCO6005856.1 Lrp/AsnC family transcriptional regulator [Actinoallomurus purpureus]
MAETSDGPSSGEWRPGQIPPGLDAVSVRMLDVLREDGRISIAALAQQVGISRANAYSRFEALRANGVIVRFTAQVDHVRSGLGVCALVFVTVRQQMWRQFRNQLALMPEVEYCAITTGQHDAMIQIRVPDVATVHHLVTHRLASIPAVKATETVFILDEVLRRPYVLPSDQRPLPKPSDAAPGADSMPLGMTRFVRADAGRAGLSEL